MSDAATGYLCRCTLCGREERTGSNPLKNGWPLCCGYTMRLEDNERFKADIDSMMGEIFAPVKEAMRDARG